MRKTTRNKKEGKKLTLLQRVMNTPDNKLRDDDHLNRPDITREEFIKAMKEIVRHHKNDKPVKPNQKKKTNY